MIKRDPIEPLTDELRFGVTLTDTHSCPEAGTVRDGTP